MSIKIMKTSLQGVLIIEPPVFTDDRGFFMETYHRQKYAALGIEATFIQDNYSYSRRSTLRGLHYQLREPQGKLVHTLIGEIFDVAVDIRKGSPTFGQWVGTSLSAENKRQIYIPEGFAHGFCVVSNEASVVYKCTHFYDPGDEYGLLWCDSRIGIDWPIDNPILSGKDSKNPTLDSVPESKLPEFNEV